MEPITDYSGIFFALWSSSPCFHGSDWERRDPPDSIISKDMTRCGRVIASYDRESGKLREPGTYIPMRHALKFGHPCKVCFR